VAGISLGKFAPESRRADDRDRGKLGEIDLAINLNVRICLLHTMKATGNDAP
jgi:hypothetical protein